MYIARRSFFKLSDVRNAAAATVQLTSSCSTVSPHNSSQFLLLPIQLSQWDCISRSHMHTSAMSCKGKYGLEALNSPKKWDEYNKVKLPPQLPDEPRRAAQVFHHRTQIRHSKDKLWYVAQMIRGMSIDQAINQLSFHHSKGGFIIKEVLLEAQEKALREQNFEFKSKMWVAESFSGRGVHVKGLRRHARGRYGRVSYNFNHYFVKLQEGDPPANYYPSLRPTLSESMKNYIDGMRGRKIINSL